MGTEIVVGGASAGEAQTIARLFAVWEGVFSRFRPESELSRVNSNPAPVVIVSKFFAVVVRDAIEAAAATEGLVDPTLAAAIVAAGYDRDFASLTAADPRPLGPPEPGRWRSLRLSGRLLARPPGTALDLNGVVKSLAVDDSLELLAGDGFVAAGGDVATRGGVTVGLPGGGSLRLRSGGLATSGRTGRRWQRGGGVQHHLIDPRSGRPSTSRWDEVTVAAGSCLAADVAAKAAFLLGDDGPGWLDDHGLPGRFLEHGELLANDHWRASCEAEAAAA